MWRVGCRRPTGFADVARFGALMVIVAVVRLALSFTNDPLITVAVVLLVCSAIGALILMSDVLSNKRRDRLSILACRRISWAVSVLAAVALLLLALSL